MILCIDNSLGCFQFRWMTKKYFDFKSKTINVAIFYYIHHLHVCTAEVSLSVGPH